MPSTPKKRISPWEWLPVAATPLLAAVSFLAGGFDSTAGRLSLFVCLGLVPGVMWRLAGRSAWRVHRIGFAAALVAFMLSDSRLRPEAGDLGKIAANWRLVTLGFLVSLTQPLWGAFRLRRLLIDSGLAIGFGKTLNLCLAGSFFNLFLPGSTGGDLYRIYAISSGERRKLGSAVASVTLDRLLGLPPLVFLILLAALVDRRFAFGNARLAGLSAFVAVSAVGSLVLMALLWAGRRRYRSGRHADKPTGRLAKISNLLASNLSRPSTLPVTLAHGFMSHVAVVVSCLLFAMALGVAGVPAPRFFLLVPLAMSVNAIPGAPGGLGQGEIAMATLLDLAAPGLGNAQAGVVIMLLFRLSNIAIGLAGGIVYATGGVALHDLESEMKAIRSEADRCP